MADQLFDASEFIDPDAITSSLSQVKNYQMQQPQQQPQQGPQMQATPSVVQPQQQQQDDGGVLGTILSIFM